MTTDWQGEAGLIRAEGACLRTRKDRRLWLDHIEVSSIYAEECKFKQWEFLN